MANVIFIIRRLEINQHGSVKAYWKMKSIILTTYLHKRDASNEIPLQVFVSVFTFDAHIDICSEDALTHWGRATHIFVGKLTIIVSDNGLSPGRRQAIIWTIAGILLIGPLGTNSSEILIGIQTFSFKRMHLKMSSAKWRPFARPQCVNCSKITACLLYGLIPSFCSFISQFLPGSYSKI